MDADHAVPRTPRLLRLMRPRRALLRWLGGGSLAFLAGVTIGDAPAKPRSGQHHHGPTHRNHKSHRDPSPDPTSCDPSSASGIMGLVTIGPMCPVERIDDPCPDQPFVATLLIRDDAGRDVCTTQSGEDGTFRVGLPPGQYELVPVVDSPARLPYASSQTVLVEPARYTEVAVSFDSGIR